MTDRSELDRRQIRQLLADLRSHRQRTNALRREGALSGLGTIGARFAPGSAEREHVRVALVAGLEDDVTYVRWAALSALRTLGEEEPAVLALAGVEHELFRGEVLYTLAHLGDPATALQTVMRLIVTEPSRHVRRSALTGILKVSRADPAMRELAMELGHKWLGDSDQRRAALGLQLLRFVQPPREPDRAEQDRVQIQRLTGLVARSDRPWQRRAAVVGLGTIGARTVPGSPERAEVRAALVAALNDEEVYVRMEAVRGLRRLGEEEPAVLALAGVEHERFRGRIFYALAHLGDPATALRTVEQLIETESSHYVRMRAVAGIGDRCHQEPAARELAVALGQRWLTSDQHIVLGLKLLRLLGVPGEPGRSLRLLEHPDEFVRWHALVWLLRHPNLTPR
jgi:HEAT repeat protein